MAALSRSRAHDAAPRDTASGQRRVVLALRCGRGYGPRVSHVRRCSRTACARPAVATLTYVYADSTAVVGPLATAVEPHSYDLCSEHAERLTAPRGWEIVRLPQESVEGPSNDDLEALADAVREAARPRGSSREPVGQGVEVGRRAHLRVVRSTPRDPDNR